MRRAEIEHFKTRGFLVKRGLVPGHLYKPFIDALWSHAPPQLERADPATWRDIGERWESRPEEIRDAEGRLYTRPPHQRTPNSQWRWHGLGHDPEWLAVTSRHPNVLTMVETLIGGPVRRPHRNRGMYNIFPRSPPEDPTSLLSPHEDMKTGALPPPSPHAW